MTEAEGPSTDPVSVPDEPHGWHKVLDAGELPEGRVTTVTVGRRTLAVTNVGGTFGAMDNHCPHQGGPLGEGSIEKGWLRCPWHGYDYSPCNGKPPGASTTLRWPTPATSAPTASTSRSPSRRSTSGRCPT